ncbi:MAG: phage tail protein [Planctomycetota bacterium]
MRFAATVLFLSSLCLGQAQSQPDQVLVYKGFSVEIDGAEVAVTSFSGGGVTFDKREVTGGERAGVVREYTITKVNWANIVIEKNAVRGDTKWKDWFESEGRGQNVRKSASIVFKNRTMTETLRATYHDCFPVGYALVECLGPCGCPEERERLTIGVGRGELSAEYVADQKDASSEVAIGRPGFRLHGAPETGLWWSISGRGCDVEMETRSADNDQHMQKRPGLKYSSDITIKGPFVKDRKAVMDWINATASGKRERVDMTLAFQNDKGDDMQTYTLSQCLPVSYQPPAVSSGNYDMLEESITFRAEETSAR